MLELPNLAKTSVALNAAPVAVLVVIGLWLARKLVKLAVLAFALAAVVGAVLWVRGGL
ncbi:MAG TPA: hypothetical protein VFA46_21990 [Actinomycetes bacterium]|jgi:hypothetical protein|nr:hypothetical protein [Actinomycetes bacterium]